MEIRGLKFRYAENMPLLFDGLNLTINSGDYVALVGGSGCGKSTLYVRGHSSTMNGAA
jgi:ABC-type bacteriocin/lantibiotic exporter with double-glycine peptidase domain